MKLTEKLQVVKKSIPLAIGLSIPIILLFLGYTYYPIPTALIFLTAFGIPYGRFALWCQGKGFTKGFTSIIVAFGAYVVIFFGVWPILGREAALWTGAMFALAGSPIVAQEFWQLLIEREMDAKSLSIKAMELLGDQQETV